MLKKHLLTGSLLTFLTASVQGGGYQLYNEGSAEALGQASAITARSDLTSLAWYNPAGLAGTEKQAIMVGNTFAHLQGNFTGTVFHESMEEQWKSIPHAYYVDPINESMTFTFSLNTPYGLASEWPNSGGLGILSERAEVVSVYATPSLAIKLNDKLSVSAGINAVYAEAELINSSRNLTGDDTAIGGTASVHLQATENLSFGARYQSEVRLTLEGNIDYVAGGTVPAQADLTLPDSVTIGTAYCLNKWTFGLDAVWTEWSDFDRLYVQAPTPEPTEQSWQDVWGLHLGAEYELNESWKLRAGYVWDESPVSDLYRSPMLPGSDRQLLTCGFGYTLCSWTLDAAYAYVWAKDTEQGSAIAAAAPVFAGEYETSAHLVSFSVGHEF